jgi:hypothetical protein
MSQTSADRSPQQQEAIRRRAIQLYQRGGAVAGHDEANWFRAEAEILRESTLHRLCRAVIVNVQGVVYTGEYDCDSADGYSPGEWDAGDPIPVRIAGNRLYLRRANGRELRTRIVKRIDSP